jgi:hypothetical protein
VQITKSKGFDNLLQFVKEGRFLQLQAFGIGSFHGSGRIVDVI